MTEPWDAIVIGSGFGGAMVAHRLLATGARVLMIERGDWVARGPEAWQPESSLEMTRHYDREIPYRCVAGGYKDEISGLSGEYENETSSNTNRPRPKTGPDAPTGSADFIKDAANKTNE